MKEIKIFIPIISFFALWVLFSIFGKKIISNAFFYFITVVYFTIAGGYLIYKDKSMSDLGKLIWLIIILIFNIIGVICYVFMKYKNQISK
jgi:hypothetical protein